MPKRKTALGFEVDKLTKSIEKSGTGESLPTLVTLAGRKDFMQITKKSGWHFNWKLEWRQPEREVYKLTTLEKPFIIQGLISLEARPDHMYMHLLESAPFNRGRDKVHAGVAGNLVAFACRLPFERGFEGNVSFLSKTKLIQHYSETLKARHIGRGNMFLDTKAAQNLMNKYFKNAP